MTAPLFSSDFYGLFKLESTSIIVDEEASAFDVAFKLAASYQRRSAIERMLPDFHERSAPSIGTLLPFLVYGHEEDHLKVLSSTPVGLLLWRIEQCLSVDALYLRKHLPEVKPARHETFLDAWNEAAQGPRNIGEFADTVKLTAFEAVRSRLFLRLLMDRSDVTVGQFLELANSALAYLALRSGFALEQPARWGSKLDPATPLVGADKFSLLEIVEASARARELTTLEGWELSQTVTDNWHGRSIFGVYAPAFNYLMEELGSAAWVKVAIDLALGTPVDISSSKSGDVLLVEEALPSCRLSRVVSGLRERIWRLNAEKGAFDTDLYVDVPRSVGLEPVTDMYRQLVNRRLSFEANWGGRWGRDITDVSQENELDSPLSSMVGGSLHLNFLEEQYRRNFLLRSENPTYFVTFQNDIEYRPILTFYRDCLRTFTGDRKDDRLPFSAFVNFCDREMGRAYIYTNTECDLAQYQRLFKAWCLNGGLTAGFVESFFRVWSLRISKDNYTPEDFEEALAPYRVEDQAKASAIQGGKS